MSSPTKGSIRGSSPDPRASRVTEEPNPCQAVAISTPTPPAPTTASRAGTLLLSVAWRLVHGRASAMPGKSGSAGRLPVQMTTACRAVSAASSPLERGDHDAPWAVQPPVAAYQGRSDPRHPVGLAGVVPIADVAVTASENAFRVDRTGGRLARAVDVADFGECNDGTQQRFTGHTCPIGTFASDEFALDDATLRPAARARSAAFCPTGPAPSTMTS